MENEQSLEKITRLLDRGAPTTDMLNYVLSSAVRRKRKDIVSLLLDRGANINEMSGETVLTVAAKDGNIDMMLLLLDRGADINTVMGSEWGTESAATTLATAALEANTDTVSLLLDRGADINLLGGKYGTALAAAAYGGSKDNMLLLLSRGADINLVGGQYGTALIAAAYVGSKDKVLLLLSGGADVNMVVDGEYGTALAAAALRKEWEGTDIVSLLLDRGADINVVAGKYGTALAAAAWSGNTDTMSLLLSRGADINIVGGRYGTALGAATTMDTVLLLLSQEADINRVAGKYGTALAAAAWEGKMDLVLLLLSRGADINMVGGEYGTALAAAAFNAKKEVINTLLDRGADINMVAGEYGTAVAAAVWWGSTDTVSLLLDRGANINQVGGKYGTALALAGVRGGVDMVTLLLDRGADTNVIGGKYGTALAAAASEVSEYNVSLLLDRGADVNNVGGKYGTALVAAASKGYEHHVSLLLGRGADVNIVGGKYGTALAAAAYCGSSYLVLLLLSRGADINAVGGRYGSALAAAAFSKRTDIVSLLLSRGANINMVVGEDGTALTMAASRRDTDTVSLLLDQGADINMVGGKYGTALAAAAMSESMDTVSLLLDRGADMNIVTSESGTVLGWAIYRGSKEIALLLLEHGADVNRVGGSYSTASGVYPSALDVAHSEDCSVESTLLVKLQTAIRERNGSPVDDIVSRSPFPMPCTRVLAANHHKGTLPSSLTKFFDIMSTKFHAGGNITPEQADVPCQVLHEEVLRHSLVALVGFHEDATHAKDTIQAKHQWVQNDIRYFVACNFDFGLAYSAARVAWKDFNENSLDSTEISVQRGQWHKHARELDEARANAIQRDSDPFSSSKQVQQEVIISPYSIMPRRLWDLKSNRVIDFRMLHAAKLSVESRPTFWAVTHSWTSDMSSVWTSINQYQWPVPIPKNISLEYLRSELLTLGAEYVWVDVLCLRQQSEDESLEQLRQQEWKLDVPTIGNIYRTAKNIVRYFNGLGVHFGHKDWDDPRHWLQRAWTLQEIADESTTINGGIPQDWDNVLLNFQGILSGKVVKLRSALRPVIQLAAQVDSLHGCEVYDLVREMSRRHATQSVDKLSGLFYLLRTTKLPCYDEKKTSEDIWGQCFHLLPAARKADFLFNFPYRGSDEQWFPTWAQVLDWPVRDPGSDHMQSRVRQDVIRSISGQVSLLVSNLWTIPEAIFNESDNPGEYEVKISNLLFGFYLPYLSQKPIDIQDPVFTLASVELGHAHNWVVCKAVDQHAGDFGVAEVKVLKKVGVIRTDSSSELLVGGLLQRMDCLFV